MYFNCCDHSKPCLKPLSVASGAVEGPQEPNASLRLDSGSSSAAGSEGIPAPVLREGGRVQSQESNKGVMPGGKTVAPEIMKEAKEVIISPK